MKEERALNVGPLGIEMVYERLGAVTDPPVFLIMGGGAQMIAWPDGFCEALVSRRLQVIRFDNRDSGLSTHMANVPVPDLQAALKGDYTTVSYTLLDMAADTIGLMDALGFDKTHLVGASMGGMIAQTIAFEYPDRVLSLTSMMSNTGAPGVGQPDFAALSGIGAPPPDDRQGYIEWQVRSLKAIGSPGFVFDEEAAAARAGKAWDRDHDPMGMLRQAVGVIKSGDRTERLQSLHVPTLVIHGDADNMCHVSGGEATAKAIPGAKLLIYNGMGHGFPRELWNDMADHISRHVWASVRG